MSPSGATSLYLSVLVFPHNVTAQHLHSISLFHLSCRALNIFITCYTFCAC